ncbi:uncharacterized protein LTR77_010510 [Saxophila tyrrhenica]|uniref:Proteasome assembly chaperone 3 n=1 Tax=Saxophila tyrrhenica TaxID=1690608 RepID=A0AAV9NYR9_9PEZI|nr:hypothetical protein LTR77_010510 [Saxophila tyrrhenica]
MEEPRPQVERAPFPAASKTTSAVINDVLTTVTRMSFSDKLLLTITPASGKLSHWVHVPLATSANPLDTSFNAPSNAGGADSNALLPRSDLTATTVFGGTKREEEVIGQTLATTLASAILHKRPSEERLLVLGLGLQGVIEGEEGREWFEEVHYEAQVFTDQAMSTGRARRKAALSAGTALVRTDFGPMRTYSGGNDD